MSDVPVHTVGDDTDTRGGREFAGDHPEEDPAPVVEVEE